MPATTTIPQLCQTRNRGSGIAAGPGLSLSRLRRSTARDRRAVKGAASAAAAGGAAGPTLTAWRVCQVRMLRSEVEVLSRDPDRGNPTLKRQGRGPELTGRSQCGWLRCGIPVRAGLEEAIGASWWRTKVKRRKAFLGGRAAPQRRCPIPVDAEGVVATRSRRNLSVSPWEICWVPARAFGW